MRKSLLFLLTSFVLLLADFAALAQAPTISSPTNGATVNPYNLTVTGTMNRPGVRRVRVQIRDLSGNDVGNSPITVSYGTGLTAASPYSIDISDNILAPLDNPYTISVSTSTATSGTVFSAATTRTVNAVIPVAANPNIVFPTNGSIFTLCQDLTVTVNSNYTGTRTLQYVINETANPSAILVDTSYVTFTNATQATTNYNLPTIAVTSLKANTQYTIYLATFDPNGDPINDPSSVPIGTSTITFTTGPTINSTPNIIFPTDNATNVTTTPTITVAAYTGCGTLTSATIEIDKDLSFTNPDYQGTIDNTGNGPFSWSAPSLQELNYESTYYLRVKFFQGATEVGTKTISFTTLPIVATDPLLNSPITQYNNRLDICSSNVTLNVNANNVAARSLLVKVVTGTGSTDIAVYNETFTFTNATQATTAFNISIPASGFSNNGNYLIELFTKDAANKDIRQLYYDLFIGTDKTAPALNTPSITAPAEGATVNSFTPVITIQSPFQGCTLNTVTYEILQGTSGTTVVASQVFNTPTYSWTVNTFLTAGAAYRIRVTYNTANGTFSDIRNFTISSNPGVTISSPLSLNNLNPCGFPVTVAAYPNATTVRVEYKRNSEASYTTFYSNPATASTAMSFAFTNTQLRANRTYDLRLTAGTGTGGSFAALSSPTDFVFTTTGINNGDTKPTLSAPLNGATDVSLTPTITFAPYTGDCGSVTSYIVTLVPVSEPNFDNGSNPDRVYLTSPTNGFVLSTALKPNTQYKIRISTVVSLNGSDAHYPFNYDNGSYTFTTIGPNLTPTQITNVADETYLNAISQTFTAATVTGATSYEWQFSTTANFSGAIFTKTSASNSLSFVAYELVSGGHYYARVRGISSGASGVFSTDPAEVVSFYNPLWGSGVSSPTGMNLTTRIFNLKGTEALNATAYYFQVVNANTVNDGNPSADFTSGNAFVYTGNFTYPGLSSNSNVQQITSASGIVLAANGTKSNSWGIEYTFNYIVMQPQSKYRIRVIPVRIVGGQIVQQMDLSAVPITTFGTMGIPNRLHTIISPTNGQTGVDNRLNACCTRISITGLALFWDITNYQVQVSTASDFSSGVISSPALDDASFTNSGTVGGVTQGNPVFDIPNLAFSTTYYARARSVAVVNGIRTLSVWSPVVQFTTKASPARLGSQGAAYDITSVAYPNPFDQTVTLHINESHKQVTVKVHDMTGRLIETLQSSGGQNIDLGKQYSKGMYLIFVEGEEQRETLKIIKQ